MKGKAMLKKELMVLCDYASISSDGKLSINGIFDQVKVEKFPGGLARVFVVATVKGIPDTSYNLTLKVQYKNQDMLPPRNIKTAPTGSNGKNNIVVDLVGLGFPKEGDYEVKLYHGDAIIGMTELKVYRLDQEPVYKLPN
jgi:hypothetical protein